MAKKNQELLRDFEAIKKVGFCTSDEAMRILKISRSTLYRLRKEQKIEYEKIGGTYYYPSLTFTRIFDAKLLQKKIIRSK